MLQIISPVFFFIAAVAGEGRPQDYNLDESPPPLQVLRQGQSSPLRIITVSVPTPQARPCRRRILGNITPDSGWIQVPQPYSQPRVYHGEHRTGSQPVKSQLKPQSLTENKTPATDDNNKVEQPGQNHELSDEHVELVEKNSVPNEPSLKSANEFQGPVPNPVFNNNVLETSKDNQNDLLYTQPQIVFQRTANDKTESQDKPVDCEKYEKTDQEPEQEHDDSENSAEEVKDAPGSMSRKLDQGHDDSKNSAEEVKDAPGSMSRKLDQGRDDSKNSAEEVKDAPREIHEQAMKLLSKCVQEARSAQEDPPSESRRSLSSILTPDGVAKPNNAEDRVLLSAQNQEKLASYLRNPAKNATELGVGSHISLLQTGRVCYACSTYFDPTCWKPTPTTTVKYCNRNNDACLTKTFKVDGQTILIRDCGNTCNEPNPYGVEPKVKTCSICHTDMCNSAYATHALNALLVTIIITVVKYTL